MKTGCWKEENTPHSWDGDGNAISVDMKNKILVLSSIPGKFVPESIRP